MRTIDTFAYPVREIEHTWIPLPDGCRLAARIWMPADADRRPVPAVLEYIPYRKRDRTRWRDEPMHRYFAGHGYAAVRVDLRGSGDSDGLLLDEYLPQEQTDAVQVIAWIAAQPWCTGAVGMMGKSWGGFNALQVAARRPPALRAVITVCSTDDRYADDAHYMGGCLLNENVIWGSVLFTLNALAPDPALVGEGWRDMWLDRLEHNPLFIETWLRHQRRDAYWRQGSVCEDFAAIRCPVYAIGGWADGYTNAVPRLLSGLSCPRKGLVGPWAHVYPHNGVPGPAIGFLQEALRWWDRWLKDTDTGIMDEPMYRVWMPEGIPPTFADTSPGRWVAESVWPSPRIEPRRFAMNWHRLEDTAAAPEPIEHRSPLTTGLAAGAWCGFGVKGDTPGDQGEDDGKSITFDSRPLTDPIEILGAPAVWLTVAADRPNAQVAVRVNDVRPDGSVGRVTYGLFNLTHRNGHDRPEPLLPHARYEVRVALNEIAHRFGRGHRIRVAVSNAYWPLAWPSPEPVTLTLFAGACTLELPVRPPDPRDHQLPPFPEPESAPGPPDDSDEDAEVDRVIERDLTTNETVYRVSTGFGTDGTPELSRVDAIGLEFGESMVEIFRVREGDPTSARAEITHQALARGPNWSTQVETRTRLAATETDFVVEASLTARDGDIRIFERSWHRRVPRDLV